MAKDWSGAWVAADRVVTPMPRPGDAAEPMNLRLDRLGLPGLCLLAGLMAALVYGWPVLLLAHILFDLTAVVFWSILVGIAIVGAIATFAITLYERGYWAENWHKVSGWADPAPWK